MIYLRGFEHLRSHISRILALIEQRLPDLSSFMKELDIIPECFLNGWLLSLMSNCIPIEFMPEVVDNFRREGWNFIYRLVLTYLLLLKERLMLSGDQAEFL